MDEQYINHTLNKDIGQMVLSSQNAGIVVLDYNVEREKRYHQWPNSQN